jgi:hypothetical protein
MADKQAEQDQLRAQRAYESYEREWRRKEKEAAEKQGMLEKDLREERFQQQKAREESIALEAQQLKEQFFTSLEKQKAGEAKIKAEANLRAEKNRQYALEVQAQIREKEIARRKGREEFFHEGVRLAQERQEKKSKIDAIKERKIQVIRSFHFRNYAKWEFQANTVMKLIDKSIAISLFFLNELKNICVTNIFTQIRQQHDRGIQGPYFQ